MQLPITRLNHAVLYVRDAAQSADFYRDVLGFETVDEMAGAVFLRAGGSDNHHDLGLFSVGPGASVPAGRAVRLYHLAWEVPTIHDLVAARKTLAEHGALVGESDHGVSKSLYARDPDGYEFEVMWAVPEDSWGTYAEQAATMPLDIDAELARYG